jgi:hypothetical protein
LAQNNHIKDFGQGPAAKKKRDSREAEELVLRYFAFHGDLANYDGRKLGKFLDEYMEAKAEIDPETAESMKNDFNDSLNRCIRSFGDTVFCDITKNRKRQSIVYYDLLMHSLSSLDDQQVDEKRDNILEAFRRLCKSKDFQRTLSGGLQNKTSIEKRREIWGRLLRSAVR